jgi:hypothetical protein
MSQDSHVPPERPALEELEGTLRQAVEQVRSQTVPENAVQRAVDRARVISIPRTINRRPWRAIAAWVGLAAAVMVGVQLWPDQSTNEPSKSVAGTLLGYDDSGSMQGDSSVRPLTGTYGWATPEKIDLLKQELEGTIKAQKWIKPRGYTYYRPAEKRIHSTVGGGMFFQRIHPTSPEENQKVHRISPEDKEKLIKEMTPGMSAKERRALKDFLKAMGGEGPSKKRAGKHQDDAIPSLGKAGKKKTPNNTDRTVWHRNSRHPRFARVYVGDGNSLELVSQQVTVTVEGCRARTVVDHIFHNPHNRRLEGTFEYPLPAGASPSYYAMFLGQTRHTVPPRFGRRGNLPPLPQETRAQLTPAQLVKQVNTHDWGKLQVARVVARVVGKQKALESYEETVREQIDPALLEYAGGNTFRGRVFPIPPRGYNRVLIAYEESLPCRGDRVLYHFPLPGRKLTEMQFALHAATADCQSPVFFPKHTTRLKNKRRLLYTRTWKNTKPRGDVLFAFVPPRPGVQALSSPPIDGQVYLYARLRPQLKKVEHVKPFASHAVFLLDTSLSEHPDRFDVSMKLLHKILKTDPAIKRFNILTFNAATAWVSPDRWLPNTPAGRRKALNALDGIVLEGATDLSAALDELARPRFGHSRKTPVNVFLLSDGQATWGETNVAALAARFEKRCRFPTRFHCYRTGLGAENLELFEALTRRGGGVFNGFGPADLAAAARAHRRQCLQVSRVRFAGGPAAHDVLVAGRRAAVYPGGELLVAARLKGTGHTTVVVEGTFLGKNVVQEYPIEITGKGELAPRGWAEIAVASLLALNDSRLEPLVTAYCQEFNIAGKTASFLVLENEAQYERFHLNKERRKTVPGDLARFLEKAWKELGRVVSGRETFERFLARIEPRDKLLKGPAGKQVRKLLALLADADFQPPRAKLRGAIVRPAKPLRRYLTAREKDPGNVDIYLREAARRLGKGDQSGAVRVLSSVVEEYPGRDDALRLVGYRLLDMDQAAHAVRLFQQVQRQRPFEPHSYRDLARSLEESGKYGLAAVQYEILLAGTWHNRFHYSLKQVGQEEYTRMLREALRRRAVGGKLAGYFGARLEALASRQPPADLRVTISWNTDNTDVDLWVIEPDGSKCYYQHNRTQSGGELSQDQTQGYGPERYQIRKARPGIYQVIVHYYRANPNLLAGETHVQVTVTRFAGTEREQVQKRTVILKRQGQEKLVFKVKF